MNRQPTLTHPLLTLRPLQPADREALYAAANDPRIWEQHPCKRNERAEFEKFFVESLESGGALVILDRATGAIIGSSRYEKIAGFPTGIEIGWTFLDRSYWGGKYNRAVKQLMIDHALTFVDAVVFYVASENIRSQRAVQKIGGRHLAAGERPEIPRKEGEAETFVIDQANR